MSPVAMGDRMDVPLAPSLTRRAFLKSAAIAGVAGGYLGGAHLSLKDDRWTPNRSFWVSRGREPVSAPLRGGREADVAIIGGGVTGLSTAIHVLLRSPGLEVVLVEAEYAGYGATGRSGGVLGEGTEMGTPPGTGDNVAHVIDLIDRFGIGCDLERAPVAQLDPYRYAAGLKRGAEGLGASVREGSRVRAIEDGAPVVVRGDGFVLRAPKVVVATNGYTPKLGVAASRIFPVHTAAAVTVPVPREILRKLPDRIHEMTSDEMYMWGRKAPGQRVLVGAGARYFYGDGLYHRGDAFLFPALHRFLARCFPALASYPFQHTWTGPMGCTADQEPIIGTAGRTDNVLYCGGYTGHGLAMGTKAGSILAGMLHGEAPPAWMLRPTLDLPGEPLRYIGVNMIINLMNLGLYSMARHE
ncbi:MAG: FAD-binding oxidoreductase [Acidobacteria bacterium]|nr:FAD-binding oxidoreductase [Acidobacteriota bacterium]